MFAGLKKVTSKTKPSLQGTEGEKMTNNLLRSGYSLVVTSGQRKYGGPPPGWEGSRPGNGCEVSLSSQHSHFFTLNSGVLWEDSQHHLRGGAHPPLGEVWADLGAEADDGSRDWSQQVRCLLTVRIVTFISCVPGVTPSSHSPKEKRLWRLSDR